jgi:hypothetical protein
MTTMGCMVDHIQHTLPIKEQFAMLYYLDFLIETVYIYIQIN